MKKSGVLILIVITVLSARVVLAGSWSVQESGTTTYLYSVCFVDANNGWAVGRDGLILHTHNGGIIWEIQKSKIKNDSLCSVFFIDQNKGWVGGEGVILYTMDGGEDWEKQVDIFALPYNIYFVDQNNGWASGIGGEGGIIFHTDNGGKTWATQTTTAETEYYGLPGVHFINPTTGWAVGGGGMILHTEDGGKTWGTQTSGTDECLKGLYFTDSKNGWVTGGRSVLHTNDSGIIWKTQTNPEEISVCGIHFINSTTGWIAGGGGKILHTTDGGETWNIQDSGTNKRLYDVCFIDKNNGWAVGAGGIILKYSELPVSNFWNVTVYPNPCKSEEKYVVFGDPSDHNKKLTRQSTIKIYNIAGEWIRTIEEVDGDGKATWDITNNEGKRVASGIYVYYISNPEGQRCTGKIGVIR
ncbi:MAG: YCF48-related protein [Candidatus Desantisbacteria bacterium]